MNNGEKKFKIEIGKRFAEIRTHLKMSQKTFAQYFSTHQSQIANIERGVIYPNMTLLSRLMFDLQINPYWLFGGIGDMIAQPKLSPEITESDPDVIELIALLKIPKCKRSILAATDQIKEIFHTDIERFRHYASDKPIEFLNKETA